MEIFSLVTCCVLCSCDGGFVHMRRGEVLVGVPPFHQIVPVAGAGVEVPSFLDSIQ